MDSKLRDPTDNDVKIVQAAAAVSIWRMGFTTGGIVTVVALLCWTYIQILQPGWVTVLLALIGSCGASGALSFHLALRSRRASDQMTGLVAENKALRDERQQPPALTEAQDDDHA